MTTRGPYAKGIERRREILDAALRVIGAEGYASATVAAIAEAVGITPNGLLHYFDSKEQLFVEALRRRDELDSLGLHESTFDEQSFDQALATATLDDLAAPLVEVVRHNAEVTGLVRLFTQLATEGVDDTHPAHAFFSERYARMRQVLATAFARLQASGQARSDLDADHAATLVLAAIDGLQVQWLYDEGIDMAAHVRTILQLLRAPEEAP